jgi:hypothetical protein
MVKWPYYEGGVPKQGFFSIMTPTRLEHTVRAVFFHQGWRFSNVVGPPSSRFFFRLFLYCCKVFFFLFSLLFGRFGCVHPVILRPGICSLRFVSAMIEWKNHLNNNTTQMLYSYERLWASRDRNSHGHESAGACKVLPPARFASQFAQELDTAWGHSKVLSFNDETYGFCI